MLRTCTEHEACLVLSGHVIQATSLNHPLAVLVEAARDVADRGSTGNHGGGRSGCQGRGCGEKAGRMRGSGQQPAQVVGQAIAARAPGMPRQVLVDRP